MKPKFHWKVNKTHTGVCKVAKMEECKMKPNFHVKVTGKQYPSKAVCHNRTTFPLESES